MRTVLTDEQIGRIALTVGCDPEHDDGALVVRLARAIEQAVLQSPEVQAMRKDAERFEFLRDNAQLFSQFGEAGNSGWCVMRRDSAITRVFTYNGQELVEAINAAMEKQI